MDDTAGEPARQITVSQVIAWNMSLLRRAAGLTQADLGARLGWTNTAVSAAERSWDGKRLREFSADDIASLALALEVPVIAFFLPPDGSHVFADGAGQLRDAGELMRRLLPDSEDHGGAMSTYRDRWDQLTRRFFAGEEGMAALLARWLGGRAERDALATQFRRDRDHFLAAATRADLLAEQIESTADDRRA